MTEEHVREILRGLVQHVPANESPLELDSLTFIELIEQLEQSSGVTVRATDLRDENFGTIALIAAFFSRKESAS